MSELIFNEIMKNPDFRKSVLIEFGFGKVQQREVVKWFKKLYPSTYEVIVKKIKQQGLKSNVESLTVELMSKEERSRLLDIAEKKLLGN